MKTNETTVRLGSKPVAENQFKVNAVFEKLPWLQDHYNSDDIKKVSFTTLDFKLLNVSCGLFRGFKSNFGGASGITNPFSYTFGTCKRQINFFSKDGEWLGQVGVKYVETGIIHKILNVFDLSDAIDREIYFEETVIEALQRIRAETIKRLEGLHPIKFALSKTTAAYTVGLEYDDYGSRDCHMKISMVPDNWEELNNTEIQRQKRVAFEWACRELILLERKN